MPSPKNEHLKAHKIDFPAELLELIRDAAAKEDENISSLIRRIMADYVGWDGPTRIVANYTPAETSKIRITKTVPIR